MVDVQNLRGVGHSKLGGDLQKLGEVIGEQDVVVEFHDSFIRGQLVLNNSVSAPLQQGLGFGNGPPVAWV